MNILYVTSEAVPFCKTGGLADVAGSLPRALAAGGDSVSVILPLYESVAEKWRDKLHFERYIYVDLAWRHLYCGLFSLAEGGVTWYFVDNEQYFKRPGLYGYYDDGERFCFFSRAVVSLLPFLAEKPDVVHCNDWQSALVPIYIRDEAVRNSFFKPVKTVLTIHNIEYQGRYGKETLGDLFGLDSGWYRDGTLEFSGDVNLLKGGIMTADAVTAVSPSYAQELKDPFFAHGMDSVIRRVSGKLFGVLNGIDTERYNPRTDPLIAHTYNASAFKNKTLDKLALQEKMGLAQREEIPLIAMVTRLVSHKGLDLVCRTLDEILNKEVQFAVLGTGDAGYERFFADAARRCPGRVAVHLGYSEELAMQIYAGADFFLMPSRSEPCGLSQMIAMRYGTVPIVRETGGLKDTVHAYEAWNGSGNGFSFAAYSAGDMCHVIGEAVELYRSSKRAYRTLQRRGMMEDFSWDASALRYREIYETISK